MIKRTKYPQKSAFSGKHPMAVLFISSNTVMAVVPDSNRIPFCIYSVNNFSNRIFLSIFDFTNFIILLLGRFVKRKQMFYHVFFDI